MKTKNNKIEDAILVLDCQRGQLGAFEQLVLHWQERLWRHAYQVIGDKEAAWDILQDTWIAVIQGIKKLSEPGAFPKWIYRIINNKCADWLRKSCSERNISAKYALRAKSCENTQQSDSKSQNLSNAIEQIPPEQRTILSLYYGNNLNISEIAEILQIKEGTVKSKLHYIRKKLREIMEHNSNG